MRARGLVVFGVILLIYTFIQASLTITTITSILQELLPNPTLALYTQAAADMPGFGEALTWFFMLFIETLIGFFLASLGVRIVKK